MFTWYNEGNYDGEDCLANKSVPSRAYLLGNQRWVVSSLKTNYSVTVVIFSIKTRLGRIFTLKVGPWHENIFYKQIKLLWKRKSFGCS